MNDAYQLVLTNILFSLIFLVGLFIITRIFKKKVKLLPLLIIISILPVLSIFRPGTYESGDLSLHSAFLYNFYQNIAHGILIPRWASELCIGYGCPNFIFEYTMPYYISSLFLFLGFSFLDSMKLMLASTYILSGITMYLFVKDEYDDLTAFVASLLYLFAPIRFIEMHFRVSTGTDVVFIFIPLAFLFAKKALKGNPLFIVLGAINILFLLLSHSSASLIIIPAAFMYAFLKRKNIKEMIYPVLYHVIGFGISAWYVLPALFEIKYTWYGQVIRETLFSFPSFIDIFYSGKYFGFLYQNQGETKAVIGYAALLVVIISVFFLLRKKFKKREKAINIYFLSLFFMCIFLMLSVSKPLWENIFLLKSFIIYWRVLVPIAFITAFLGAMLIRFFDKRLIFLFCFFIIFSTILNWGNQKMVGFNPADYFNHTSLYTEYIVPGDPEYTARYDLIKDADKLVPFRPKSHLEILSGTGTIKEISRNPIEHNYIVEAKTDLLLAENTAYFPGWTVYANGEQVPLMLKHPSKLGKLVFSLKKNNYVLQAKFEDTPIRSLGKIISLSSLFILIILCGFKIPAFSRQRN